MATNVQVLLNKNLQDINPILAGWADNPPGANVPSRSRNHSLLHYVRKGRGVLHAKGGDIPIHAGQAFLLMQGETPGYSADLEDPWSYSWVGFTGSLAEEFSVLPRVFDVEDDLLPYLRTLENPSESMTYDLASDLFRLYARLVRQGKDRQHYVQTVKEYIESNYMQKICVENIANRLGLDRRYLSQQFKRKTGYTIQGYILDTRLRAAKQHMMQGCSVSEAALLSGFNDVSNFSKFFSREEGSSPREFKKIIQKMMQKPE